MADIKTDPPAPPSGPINPRFEETDEYYVGLTDEPLNILTTMAKVKSPKAGAVVMFAGTTRDNFQGKTVTHLAYSSYIPMAIKSLEKIASTAVKKHGLIKIAILHRLGEVPILEESILVIASSPHRQEAFDAARDVLEECKEKLEVWKREEFEEGGVWRANKE